MQSIEHLSDTGRMLYMAQHRMPRPRRERLGEASGCMRCVVKLALLVVLLTVMSILVFDR